MHDFTEFFFLILWFCIFRFILHVRHLTFLIDLIKTLIPNVTKLTTDIRSGIREMVRDQKCFNKCLALIQNIICSMF